MASSMLLIVIPSKNLPTNEWQDSQVYLRAALFPHALRMMSSDEQEHPVPKKPPFGFDG